jgi:hypothetical protein
VARFCGVTSTRACSVQVVGGADGSDSDLVDVVRARVEVGHRERQPMACPSIEAMSNGQTTVNRSGP